MVIFLLLFKESTKFLKYYPTFPDFQTLNYFLLNFYNDITYIKVVSFKCTVSSLLKNVHTT